MSGPNELEASAQEVRQRALALRRGALVFLWTAMLGQGGVFGVMFYLWRDWKLGYNVHPPLYEPVVATVFGVLIGLGLAVPFVSWFRLQAAMANVQLSTEHHTRMAEATARETARSIQSIADAGMSGEWGFAAVSDRVDPIGPPVDS